MARLSPIEYDRLRKREAKRLGIRVETLDAEVARRRAQLREDALFQSALSTLNSPELSTSPVNGATVLRDVSERFTHYLVVPPGAADAFTLWTAHTHAFGAFLQSPRLNISSPEPGCGKTTTLDLLATLTPRALRTENLTAPVLFRLVDQYQPTLLLDEVDAWLWQAEELRGLLNAGHKRGACAYRCEADGISVRPFKAFAPAALAGIGALPGTLHDRSIFIPLAKAEPGQVTARFDDHRTDLEKDLCRQLARWAADNFAVLQSCDPPLPPTAFNRLADNWRPLFAVAQVAGGDWPERAKEAFERLSKPNVVMRSGSRVKVGLCGDGVGLLAEIRRIFEGTGAEKMTSKQIVEGLRNSAASLGVDARRITERWLAWRLAAVGIRPGNVQVGKVRAKGYLREEVMRET
jgi:putative DNA primase/helicase